MDYSTLDFPPPLAGRGPSAHASGALVPGERLRRSVGVVALRACLCEESSRVGARRSR